MKEAERKRKILYHQHLTSRCDAQQLHGMYWRCRRSFCGMHKCHCASEQGMIHGSNGSSRV